VDSTVTSADILLRLAAAVLAGAILGYDRGTRGHIAGLRTTILICLAAAGAMIEANLTLSVVGRTESSFTQMDALRFPLGILSGIGFIGAGAILKRGNMVTGVTTAATLWLATVIGLILGGGYFLLGGATVVIAFFVLAALVHLEPLMRREHRGSLTIDLGRDGPSNDALRSAIAEAGYKITSLAVSCAEERQQICCRVTWTSRHGATDVPPLVERLVERPGILKVDWQPIDAGQHSD
jgi:putative Mg2+ transporter-C (MgtC) family protein